MAIRFTCSLITWTMWRDYLGRDVLYPWDRAVHKTIDSANRQKTRLVPTPEECVYSGEMGSQHIHFPRRTCTHMRGIIIQRGCCSQEENEGLESVEVAHCTPSKVTGQSPGWGRPGELLGLPVWQAIRLKQTDQGRQRVENVNLFLA